MRLEKCKEFNGIKNFLWKIIWNLKIEDDDYETFFNQIIEIREQKIGKNIGLGHKGLLINKVLWEIGGAVVKIRFSDHTTLQKSNQARDMLNLLNKCYRLQNKNLGGDILWKKRK